MSDERRRLMREAICDGVDAGRLPGLEPMLDRLEAVLDGWRVSGFAPSPARRGLDWLLAHNPHLELVEAEWQREDATHVGGPWLLLTLGQRSADGSDAFALHFYAIWKSTGAVHGVGVDGAVTDDPLFVP